MAKNEEKKRYRFTNAVLLLYFKKKITVHSHCDPDTVMHSWFWNWQRDLRRSSRKRSDIAFFVNPSCAHERMKMCWSQAFFGNTQYWKN